MKLSIIIVNYNVNYFLEQALISVFNAEKDLEMEVWVVDNNSVDGSVQMVKEKFPKVKVIANKKNVGFSVANNQAIRQSKGEYVLLLNPDTILQEDTLVKTVLFMDNHPKAGGLGIKMIDGSGKYLPESKRGFPSPFVSFTKMIGLSKLFPKSPTYNRYYLGFLDKDKNAEIDVLAGAYMFLRKSVLDQIGLLDEQFFMYGEDIDLSYRIKKAGFKNYYFADSSIVHYKGESTKRGSFNYVKTFYNAMILFAQKHFKGQQAGISIFLLKIAIYLRAGIALFTSFVQKIVWPLFDGIILIISILILGKLWGNYMFDNPNYYHQWKFYYFNIPLYLTVWLGSIFFNGGYDYPAKIWRIVRGILVGGLFLSAIYGLLNKEFQFSRALVLMGTLSGAILLPTLRIFFHFLKNKNFNYSEKTVKSTIIVGSLSECERVKQLLHRADVNLNIIGIVSDNETNMGAFLGSIDQLQEISTIYKIDEVIFCSKDISNTSIMSWMTKLGSKILYKILPEKSMTIIGSSSKNTNGNLYTVELKYQISDEINKRNKRVFDFMSAIMILLLLPLFIYFLLKNKISIAQVFNVLIGKKTWIGYNLEDSKLSDLPKLKPSIFSTTHALQNLKLNDKTIHNLNFHYAKSYHLSKDIEQFFDYFFLVSK